MRYQALRQIKSLYFSYNEVSAELSIQPENARVLCSRYVSNGLLVRVKRNMYVLRERWDYLTDIEVMQIANVIQVPSYVSLTTALSFYGYTTQLQYNFIESVCVQRSYNRIVLDKEFKYIKIPQNYYRNFIKHGNVFIATPEKALMDAVYLTAFGKYHLDFSALEISKVDRNKVGGMLRSYPERVQKVWIKYAAP